MRRPADLWGVVRFFLASDFFLFLAFRAGRLARLAGRAFTVDHAGRGAYWAGRRHPHDLVGDPVGLLLVGIVGLADRKFWLDPTGAEQSLDGEITGRLLRAGNSGRKHPGYGRPAHAARMGWRIARAGFFQRLCRAFHCSTFRHRR